PFAVATKDFGCCATVRPASINMVKNAKTAIHVRFGLIRISIPFSQILPRNRAGYVFVPVEP
ncbi:MAG TPA: hypothetical protein VN476_15535, partial [Pyrinomonadaceae bacterium]|nr:hypothetical protein [Pyrinomonadaceae bacterium]